MAEAERLEDSYKAAVEQGCLEDARHARATLSDFLESVGKNNPLAEEQLRIAMGFPAHSLP
jgi:hypothetical protein